MTPVYQLRWLYSPVPEPTGLLIPIYSREKGNVQYVPEVTKEGTIERFLPIHYDLGGEIHTLGTPINTRVGEDVSLAWLSGRGEPVVVSYSEASKRYKQDDLAELGTLLCVQLARVFSDNPAIFWDAAQAYSERREKSGFLGRRWVMAETYVYQRFSRFWEVIASAAARGPQTRIFEERRKFPTEREALFEWLIEQEDQKSWGRAWRYARDRYPSDERVQSVAVDWASRHLEDPEFWNSWTGVVAETLVRDWLTAISLDLIRTGMGAHNDLREIILEASESGALFVTQLALSDSVISAAIDVATEDMTSEDCAIFILGCLEGSYLDVEERAYRILVPKLGRAVTGIAQGGVSPGLRQRLVATLGLEDIKGYLRGGNPVQDAYALICERLDL